MPKTKLENLIFTAIMAFVMVYGMICYNISLNLGGCTNAVFLMAFGELRIMWPVAIVLEYFHRREAGTEAGFYLYEADRPAAVYYLCDIFLHLRNHVPDDVPCGDIPFQGADHWNFRADLGAVPACSLCHAVHHCLTACPAPFQIPVPEKEDCEDG